MYEFYRTSLVGKALVETLDQKVNDKLISEEQAQFILRKFDETVPNIFNSSVNTSITFTGDIVYYKYMSNVWKFFVKNFVMTVNNEYCKDEYMVIVATDSEAEITNKKKKGL